MVCMGCFHGSAELFLFVVVVAAAFLVVCLACIVHFFHMCISCTCIASCWIVLYCIMWHIVVHVLPYVHTNRFSVFWQTFILEDLWQGNTKRDPCEVCRPEVHGILLELQSGPTGTSTGVNKCRLFLKQQVDFLIDAFYFYIDSSLLTP